MDTALTWLEHARVILLLLITIVFLGFFAVLVLPLVWLVGGHKLVIKEYEAFREEIKYFREG